MRDFTGTEMLLIDIANTYGMDKDLWDDRLMWAILNAGNLETLAADAEEPMMYRKAVKAYRDTQAGIPTGHNMFLDATASGLQICAALSGCKETAKRVNMIFTGRREDVYNEVAFDMNKLLTAMDIVDRTKVKKPVMTHYYNKTKQEEYLNDNQIEAFYHVLSNSFEGAEAVKDTINLYWNSNANAHMFTLPDGHVAYIPVTEKKTARIEVDELDGVTFSYRFEANEPSTKSTSLVPNIIHAIDAYIVRKMIRRANGAGFELAHIFDAFCAHPNYMVQVAQFYREIMAEIADSNLLSDILSEIAGKKVVINKFSNDLSKDILASSYMLS